MHHFRSRPHTAFDKYRQTRSAADCEEIEQSTDEALINPHMPQYITKSPWYLHNEKPTLSHQRAKDGAFKVPLDHWYTRGVKKAKAVQKYRKGTWTNCGSATHTEKFWVDRPRKFNAKFQNKTFGDDEEIQDVNLTFEARKDRWNGFDPSMYNKEVIPKWEAIENERKRLKAEKAEEKSKDVEERPKDEIEEIMSDSDLAEDSEEDSDKWEVEGKHDLTKNPRIKTLNKNLRSRQETAKYLQNIKDNTAHYDGKSRAMRHNPNQEEEAEDKKLYQGDNHNIYSGKFFDLMDQDNFTIEAQEKGNVELNSVAMPSQAEIAYKQFKQKKSEMLNQKNQDLFAKYGGLEHTKIPDDFKMKALKEQYAGENEGEEAQPSAEDIQRTEDEEIAIRNGHAAPWGSFNHPKFGTGYECWYSFEKDSKCRGREGRKDFYAKEYELIYGKKPDLDSEAKKKAEEKEKLKQAYQSKLNEFMGTLGEAIKSQSKNDKHKRVDQLEVSSSSDESSSSDSSDSDSSSSSSDSSSSSSFSSNKSQHSDSEKKRRRDKKSKQKGHTDMYSLDPNKIDPKKLKEAIKEEKRRKRQKVDEKGYNSLKADDVNITAEGLEAYKMQRELFEDPMRNFKDDEDL